MELADLSDTAPGIQLPPFPQCCGDGYMLYLAFHVGAGDLNSSPYTCVVDTLLIEPFPPAPMGAVLNSIQDPRGAKWPELGQSGYMDDNGLRLVFIEGVRYQEEKSELWEGLLGTVTKMAEG